MLRTPRVAALLAVVLLLAACGDDQDPGGAKELWDRIHAQAYPSWRRPPSYPVRTASFTLHGDQVEIFINPVMTKALGTSLTAWPEGAIIVKDIYASGKLVQVAAMEKRKEGWFWAEWSASGDSIYSGKPKVCVSCHDNRAGYSDFTYSLEFPR
jgi:hypothetical protein